MKTTKIFRVTKGNEKTVATEMANFYNRQGAMGNKVSRAIIAAAGEDVVYTVFADGKVDDGRDIDNLEERKGVEIIRVAKGEETAGEAEISKVYDNDEVTASRAFITAVGEDLVYTIFTEVVPKPADDGDDDDDDDDNTDDDGDADYSDYE